MEQGISQASLVNDDMELRNTWRTAFRILSLLLGFTGLILAACALHFALNAATPADLSGIPVAIDQNRREILQTLSLMSDTDNKIYKQVALESPVALLNTESTLMSAITSLSYQINNAANNSGCGAPVHDKDFINGVAKELFVGPQYNASNYRPSKFLEHLNFIPAPTTGNGCTRIPSFDLAATHWCYTHNVILGGCNDHAHSYQHISLGILKVSATGNVFLSTLRSINLDDDENRKSCSISATPLGCDLLCAKVTETEEEDYNSDAATKLVHGRLGFDGAYHEQALPVESLFSDWVANYPTVGGGSYFDNRVWFGVYGGIKPGSQTDLLQSGKYAIYHRYNNTCPDDNSTQIERARSSYRPQRFGQRLVQQAILSIRVESSLGGDPKLSVLDNTVVLMGAEARIMTFGHVALMYQRGSSYFPSALLYPLSLTNGSATASKPYIFEQYTRPGSPPCQATARCPNSCVTGVYTDAYPLFWSDDHKVTGVYGMMLDDNTLRLNPVAAVFNRYDRSGVTRVSSSSTKAAYTTNTCFKVVKTKRVYCLSIAEIGNTLFGEFRITPLLSEIILDPSLETSDKSHNRVKSAPEDGRWIDPASIALTAGNASSLHSNATSAGPVDSQP
uniref:Hemagglutinin-neuraminidase n=1 Tax=avian paramyxovirus 9 TaxID=2560326 RepID=D8VP11_9MONO|nr:hemagglutinin-neuraminidase [Avian orthoavulavirus 9]